MALEQWFSTKTKNVKFTYFLLILHKDIIKNNPQHQTQKNILQRCHKSYRLKDSKNTFLELTVSEENVSKKQYT